MPLSEDVEASERLEHLEPLLLEEQIVDSSPVILPARALACFFLQHLSNSVVTGLYEFSCFLFLIEIFRDTLVPSSLVGLVSTLTGLSLSGWIGGLVDATDRLTFVKWIVGAEKILYIVIYTVFAGLFGPLESVASLAFHFKATWSTNLIIWCAIFVIVSASSFLAIAKTGLNVAFERDWVSTIANGDAHHLTMLNAWMRRIDLCSKLGAPLIVSLLTTLLGYQRTTMILLCFSGFSLAAELLWFQVVYRAFPILQHPRTHARERTTESSRAAWLSREMEAWSTFISLPVFWSSLSIACLYLTTLSYDGTFIAYIKSARGWDDAFIAGMRGLCVLTGLLGTVIMPLLETWLGLERAGAWSIWFEASCLGPVVLAFFIGAPEYGSKGSFWNSAVLFGGIALSRIGLFSFDLCQLKELQLALDTHPMRNQLTALQSSLANMFDLLKYALTLLIATPDRFRYTALVSWAAVVTGGILYSLYLRRIRGHLFHFEWLKKAT
ncbi:Ferroporti-1 [Kockovaella imperatae]|uniref:Solute carrier family 40 member n=1 Tax=Kockovaella imperatae TaxID=4999 RepID=A0A1Y1UHK3_9TREE|nr:Ferroporti-1 [Kockovaella imperatae]ORX37528.1 Ferroporti-1 [Kockovaella imperatae]